MRHLHILASLAFGLGLATHTLSQFTKIVGDVTRPADSFRELLRKKWPAITIRTVIAYAFFGLWLQGELAGLLKTAGVPLPAIIAMFLDLHVSGPIAVIAGFGADSALGYIPKLGTDLPPIVGPSVSIERTSEVTSHTDTTKVTVMPSPPPELVDKP